MAFGVLFLDKQICRDLKNKFSPQENSVNGGVLGNISLNGI